MLDRNFGAPADTLLVVENDGVPCPDIASMRLLERASLEQATARVPSVVLGAARAGQVLDVVAAGYADVENRAVAKPEAPYRIGSITKTFTAALVLSLAETGVIGLDDRVENFLPGTPLGEVTLRALLSHSGGVQREVPGDMWESMQGPDAPGLRAALSAAELVDRPGARWHYSNLGYAVLGQVVEVVTGTPCSSAIDENLIGPLGLSSTSWSPPSDAAVGYRADPYEDRVHREPVMDQGAVGVGGQLWSTAADLLVWGDALAGGFPDVVAPAVVDAMHTPQVMVDRKAWTTGWGLGLILDRRGGRIAAGHTGAMPGFQAALSVDRATRSVAAVLSNATRGVAVGALAAQTVDDLIGSAPRSEPAAAWTADAEPPAGLGGVLGRWWSEADETVFSWRGDALYARLVSSPADSETWFEQIGPDSFRAVSGRFRGERLAVRRGPDGEVAALVWATYPFTRAPR